MMDRGAAELQAAVERFPLASEDAKVRISEVFAALQVMVMVIAGDGARNDDASLITL